MPWKFIRASETEALQRQQETLAKIDLWWAEFAHSAPEIEALIHQGIDPDPSGWVRGHLEGIDPALRWEFGLQEDGGYGTYLVITPETQWHLRPVAETILERAPQLFGWSFSGYRPAESAERAADRVKATTGQTLGITASVRPRIGAIHRIDLLFQTRLARDDDRAAREVATATAKSLLGEDVFSQWVGDVDVEEPSRTLGTDFLLFPRLRPTVMTMVESIQSKLPKYPYWGVSSRRLADNSQPYKLNPRPADDYPGQADVVVGTSSVPELRRAVTGSFPFHSSSFSRMGESFCYLKIDAGDVSMDGRLARRAKFEDVLNKPLRQQEAARIVGSATGLRYIYFDLVVIDLVKTVETVRKALVPLGLPERSWLLFYDAALADEYVAMRSSSPPPPATEEGRLNPMGAGSSAVATGAAAIASIAAMSVPEGLEEPTSNPLAVDIIPSTDDVIPPDIVGPDTGVLPRNTGGGTDLTDPLPHIPSFDDDPVL